MEIIKIYSSCVLHWTLFSLMAYELCSSCVLPWTFRLMAYEFALSLNEEELATIKRNNKEEMEGIKWIRW